MRSFFSSLFKDSSIKWLKTGDNRKNFQKNLTATAFNPKPNPVNTLSSSDQKELFRIHRDKPYLESGHFDGSGYLMKCSTVMAKINNNKTNFLNDLKNLSPSEFQRKYQTQLSKNPGLKNKVVTYFDTTDVTSKASIHLEIETKLNQDLDSLVQPFKRQVKEALSASFKKPGSFPKHEQSRKFLQTHLDCFNDQQFTSEILKEFDQ